MVISRSLIVFLLLLAPLGSASAKMYYSEDGSTCSDKDFNQSVANIAKAKKLEQDGSYRQAYEALNHTECLWATDDEQAYRAKDKELTAIQKRLYKALGEEAEKKKQLEEARTWFSKDESTRADVDRVELKIAQAKPDNFQIVSHAVNYFKRRNIASSLKTVQAMAVQNAKPLLAQEEKQFASHLDDTSLKTLEGARTWLEYAAAPENRLASERAEKRGDARTTETSATFLKAAIRYYDFANKPEKAKAVRDKAKKLGDAAKAKGENEAAVDYYQVAGLGNEARDLQKRTESQQRKDEGKRQQQFKKDQDNLEKELGF